MEKKLPRLLDILSAGSEIGFTFLDAGYTRTHATHSLVEESAHRMASSIQALPGDTIAMMLSNNAGIVSALWGTWLAGKNLASLPLPARAQRPEDYLSLVSEILSDIHAEVLVVDESLAALCSALEGIRVITPDQLDKKASAEIVQPNDDPHFIQFSSGSTSRPKGVVLTHSAIVESIVAMLSVVKIEERSVTVSWLPWSHDMGLIGMLLLPWVSTGLAALGHSASPGPFSHITTMDPTCFVRDPSSWLSEIARWQNVGTAAPNFALDRTCRHLARHPFAESAEALKFAIIGSELVRPHSLLAFQEALAPNGLQTNALAPAYGMAEMTLGIALTPQYQQWRSVSHLGRDYVSLGAPLSGIDLAIVDSPRSRAVDPSGRIGEILVSGPGAAARYADGTAIDLPLLTGDVGFLDGGELFVTARVDDVVLVAGSNIFAPPVEAALAQVDGVHAGSICLVQDDASYAIVVEPSRDTDSSSLVEAINATAVKSTGARPSRVVVLAPGQFPKTSSGKLRRPVLTALLAAGELG